MNCNLTDWAKISLGVFCSGLVVVIHFGLQSEHRLLSTLVCDKNEYSCEYK